MATEADPTPDGVTEMRQNVAVSIAILVAVVLLAYLLVAVFSGIRGGHGHGQGGTGTAPGLTNITGNSPGGKSK
jgi:hypothetical protein